VHTAGQKEKVILTEQYVIIMTIGANRRWERSSAILMQQSSRNKGVI